MPLLVVTGTGIIGEIGWASGSDTSSISETSGICSIADSRRTSAESSVSFIGGREVIVVVHLGWSFLAPCNDFSGKNYGS